MAWGSVFGGGLTRSVLALILIAQQLTLALPAGALTNIDGSHPLDLRALGVPGDATSLAPPPAERFRGDAATSISVTVAPGVGEATPRLRFAYSSSGGNGPLGLGWRLDLGVPASIERSIRDGAPDYDGTDTFEYGGQRLIETAEAGRYVTERFDSSRIDLVAGVYWRVLRPDGTRLYYGYQPDALNESVLSSEQVMSVAPIAEDCPPGVLMGCTTRHEVIPAGVAFAWYLDRVEDRNGNVIHLDWDDLGDPGVRYLTRIDYGEHVTGDVDSVPDFGGSTAPTGTATRSVVFSYDAMRADVLPTFRSGFRREIRHRLNRVTPQAGGDPVREYHLFYVQSEASGRSLLAVVEERGADDDAAGAFVHTFSYTDGGAPGWSALDTRWALPGNAHYLDFPCSPLEICDLIDAGYRIVDLNADSYPDLFESTLSGSTGASLGGPSGWSTTFDTTWASPINFVDTLEDTTNGVVFGDFNGDRRIDMLWRRLRMEAFSDAVPSNPPCIDRGYRSTAELETGLLEGSDDGSAWANSGTGWLPAPEHEFPPIDILPQQTVLEHPLAPDETYPIVESCPRESFPTAFQILRGSTAAGVDGLGYTSGVAIADVNGDGLDDLSYFRFPQNFEWAQDMYDPSAGEYRYDAFRTDELRTGVLLNHPDGLALGTANFSHLGLSTGVTFGGRSEFVRAYDHPRWQLPQSVAGLPEAAPQWSSVIWCHAWYDEWNPLVSVFHNGSRRMVDVNVDGLPDLLQASTVTHQALLNDGYNWFMAETEPDSAAIPPVDFLTWTSGTRQIAFFDHSDPRAICNEGTPSSGVDNAWRVVDVNGDGGPDIVGGPTEPFEVRLWDASAPNGVLWRPDGAQGWALPDGVDFLPVTSPMTRTDTRLADVNADGMIDIVVDEGAFLNTASRPDLLDVVTGPFGAATDFDYAPSTVFDAPPTPNPTVDGQMGTPDPIWVVSRITVDPGAPFGQPVIVTDLEYFGGVYDLDDRAFRGFREVHEIGPAVDGVRAVTETEFHVSDALAGRPVRVSAFSEPEESPGNGTLLQEVRFDYAHQLGDETSPTVSFGDGSNGTLLDADNAATQPAFTQWSALASGVARAHLASFALPIGIINIAVEGTASPEESFVDRSFDFFGNVIRLRAYEDASDTVPTVEANLTYSLLDTDVGGQRVLVANRPETITMSGDGTGLPPDTVLQRETQIFYDGATVLGDVARGNPTSVQRKWIVTGLEGTIHEKWVEVQRAYDAHGNVLERTEPRDTVSRNPFTVTRFHYDPASMTFVDSIERAADTPLALETTFVYAVPGSSGCGTAPADANAGGSAPPGEAPPGLGLVCEVMDANDQVRTLFYDRFGRLINERGPNGYERAIGYLYSLPAAQHIKVVTRWDPAADAPAIDSNAILERRFFDGLGRTRTELRKGRGGDIASRKFGYDAAGRLRRALRWEYGGSGEATTFERDALGRLTRIDLPGGAFSTRTYRPREVERRDELPGEGLVRKHIERRDGLGRLSEVHEFADPNAATGAITSYRYDPFGSLVQIQDPIVADPSLCPSGSVACPTQDHTTEIFYDSLGNRARLEDPDAGVTKFTRDDRGRVMFWSDARGITLKIFYDELDRLVERGNAGEGSYKYHYGLSDTTVPNGVGRLIRAEEANAAFDEFEYDDAGNPKLHRRTMDGVEFEFTRTFDPLGRVLTTTYPDGETVTWHYDKSLLHRISSSGGSYTGDYLADVQYDALDRPVELELGGAAGAAVVDETRTFDPVTAQLERIDALASGTTIGIGEYSIDAFGRVRDVTAHTQPVGGGALKTHSLPTHQYDGLDRIIAGSEYDVLGNLLRKDNWGSSYGWSQFAYEDPVRPHALTSATAEDPETASDLAYFYDAAGNAETKVRSGGETGSVTVAITYDAAGLPKSVSPSNGLATTFTYSALGQRVKTARPDESVLSPEPGFDYLPGQSLVNKHFFLGDRRIASSATVWSAPPAGSSAGWMIRMPDLPAPGPWLLFAIYGSAILGGGLWIARRRPDEGAVPLRRPAALVTVALCAPTLIASPCALPPAQTALLGAHTEPVFFYVTDHLGSTVLAVDQTGAIRTRELYLPFGDRTVSEGERLRHRFTGAEVVQGTTLYILGVRLYDSETGRFLQPDPLSDPRDPQRLNRYTYAGNNPLSFTDRTGLEHTGVPPRDEVREGANQSLYRYLAQQQERAYVGSILAALRGFADALSALGGLGGGRRVGESAPASFETGGSQSGSGDVQLASGNVEGVPVDQLTGKEWTAIGKAAAGMLGEIKDLTTTEFAAKFGAEKVLKWQGGDLELGVNQQVMIRDLNTIINSSIRHSIASNLEAVRQQAIESIMLAPAMHAGGLARAAALGYKAASFSHSGNSGFATATCGIGAGCGVTYQRAY